MSNSIVNSSLTLTVPAAMLTGVMPKSRCFKANLPTYRPLVSPNNRNRLCHTVQEKSTIDLNASILISLYV